MVASIKVCKLNRRRLKDGLATSEGSQPIGREILKKLCHSLILTGDSESMKKTFAMVTTFLAEGRAGKITCSSIALGL